LSTEEVNLIQAPAQKMEDEYWNDISQFLQHCTERRFAEFKDWDIDKMQRELVPIVNEFDKAFPRPLLVSEDRTLGGANSTASFRKINKTL